MHNKYIYIYIQKHEHTKEDMCVKLEHIVYIYIYRCMLPYIDIYIDIYIYTYTYQNLGPRILGKVQAGTQTPQPQRWEAIPKIPEFRAWGLFRA